MLYFLFWLKHSTQDSVMDTKRKQGGHAIIALLSLQKPDISNFAVHEYMLCIVYIFISQKVI